LLGIPLVLLVRKGKPPESAAPASAAPATPARVESAPTLAVPQQHAA
jgi:hypothetical protein